MPIVSVAPDVDLYVKVWGQGKPIILIHGWPLTADSWDDIALSLAEAGYKVIAYDRRGFGRSAQPWGGYEYDTLADDLAAVIRDGHYQDVTLVGFSMGGGEIARYMSRHGGKGISKAALISSIVPYMLKTADNPQGTDAAVFNAITQGIKKDRADFFAGFFKDFFGVGLLSHSISDAALEWVRDLAMQAGLNAVLGCAKAFGTTDFRSELKFFSVPTLIVHGTADKIVPMEASARAAAKGIRHATLIEYDGAPHGVFATHKDRLTDDLLKFLKQ